MDQGRRGCALTSRLSASLRMDAEDLTVERNLRGLRRLSGGLRSAAAAATATATPATPVPFTDGGLLGNDRFLAFKALLEHLRLARLHGLLQLRFEAARSDADLGGDLQVAVATAAAAPTTAATLAGLAVPDDDRTGIDLGRVVLLRLDGLLLGGLAGRRYAQRGASAVAFRRLFGQLA